MSTVQTLTSSFKCPQRHSSSQTTLNCYQSLPFSSHFYFTAARLILCAVKSLVSREWYITKYEDITITQKVLVTNPFRVSRKDMTIEEQSSHHTLALPESTKRVRVLDESTNKWIDTEPISLTSQLAYNVEELSLLAKTLYDRLQNQEKGNSDINEKNKKDKKTSSYDNKERKTTNHSNKKSKPNGIT